MFGRMLKKFQSKKNSDSLINDDNHFSLPQKDMVISTLTAEAVTDFSSQYGSELSISYTACNLAGKANVYPNYGDFTHACVFRIYGPWWDRLPSSRAPFYRTPANFHSQDYIELSFQTKLYPLKITVYETYNPGCVVRILACENGQDTDVDTGLKYTRWKTLWEGEPENIPPDKLAARKFSPVLEPCPFATNLIRLEMCHHNAYYYTELDCVELTGTTENPYEDQSENSQEHYDFAQAQNNIVKNMDKLSISDLETHGMTGIQLQDFSSGAGSMNVSVRLGEVTQNSTISEKSNDCDEKKEIPESDNGFFKLLPEEVIQLILSFLDVLSLCRVARTCRLFWEQSYDSLQYTELNLQPHWTQVNDIALDSLQSRGRFLQRLNLSWCHGNILSDRAFRRYIKTCGKDLKDLYLSSCNFLQSNTVIEIVESCPNLVELDLGSCRQIESVDLIHIEKLKHLQRLNLYRTMVNTGTIISIINSCPELRHLNLGSCIRINNYDGVLYELGVHCPNLESLDLWRARTVSHVGLTAIAEGCPNLMELDIGWCNDVKSSTNCITDLVKSCLKLKKLFLTANRTICDTDLHAIAEHSRDLEQLDILGTRQVTAAAAERLMQKCEKLYFFDVSFCSGIDQYTVQVWKGQFPQVAVKRSFQN